MSAIVVNVLIIRKHQSQFLNTPYRGTVTPYAPKRQQRSNQVRSMCNSLSPRRPKTSRTFTSDLQYVQFNFDDRSTIPCSIFGIWRRSDHRMLYGMLFWQQQLECWNQPKVTLPRCIWCQLEANYHRQHCCFERSTLYPIEGWTACEGSYVQFQLVTSDVVYLCRCYLVALRCSHSTLAMRSGGSSLLSFRWEI